jgi:hypothetical protein
VGARLRGGSSIGSSSSSSPTASAALLYVVATLCLFVGGVSGLGATRLWRAAAGIVIVEAPEPELGQKEEEEEEETTAEGMCC